MWSPEAVVSELRARGHLWESAPGLVGIRGPLVRLARDLGDAIARIARAETDDEWRVPSGMAFETLESAQYFASFPQWLTAASHLSADEAVLEHVATSQSPGVTAREHMLPASAALSPAICYHTYAALAGSTISGARLMTAEDVCWRHEGARFAPLARGWAFRMREIVCLGSTEVTENFRQRGMLRVTALAESFGIATTIVQATDPFFAPTARGRGLLQKLKALKHELIVDNADGSRLAIASFNNHERFFGEAFSITLDDGSPAHSACVAFGLERWLLAFLVAHGPYESGWPEIAADASKHLVYQEY